MDNTNTFSYWLLIAILMVGLIFLSGWIIAILWNYLMPTLFGLTTISVKQGIALWVLSNWLFGAKSFTSGLGEKGK